MTCDTTSVRQYNSPTAVAQLRLKAQPAANAPQVLMLGGLMLVVLGGVLLAWRARRVLP
jgi:hypothetical protein